MQHFFLFLSSEWRNVKKWNWLDMQCSECTLGLLGPTMRRAVALPPSLFNLPLEYAKMQEEEEEEGGFVL